MNVHFYWKEPKNPKNGEGWQFLNRLTLVSHVEVGHTPIIWVDGDEPINKYWISDIPEIEIRNAKEIYETSDFYKKDKSNPRTASTLFSFEIVRQTGEYYADTDAIALRHWPDWKFILAGSEPEHINVGVIKMPKNHPVLKCSIANINPEWGNVKVFTNCCKEFGLWTNVPDHWFYPVHWKEENHSTNMNCRGKFLDNIYLQNDCFSYHYYSNKVSLLNIDHTWLKNPKLENSLFKRLVKRFFKRYTVLNRKIVDEMINK